ncbi:MAG: carboxypeptidase regulatory-like domain-containing protein [Saprospiraceae bacterium]|nr:carboxypeptidase regulatory-like domain-containing protein [Saprospiraceae bacterium]
MKPHLLYIGLMVTALSCNNTTIVEGVVQNAKTGVPIEGAKVTLMYEYQEYEDHTGTGQKIFTTDSEGRFSFSDKCIWATHISEVRAPRYALSRGKFLEDNFKNKVVIELTPLDGILQLTVKNETGQFDSLFLIVQNEGTYFPYYSTGNQSLSEYPLYLNVGMSYVQNFLTCKSNSTRIGWSSARPMEGFIFQDSVFVDDSDTTYYTVSY